MQLLMHKGVIVPQLITPAQILEQIKNSQAEMPNDVSVEILRVEVVLLIGGHWPPIKLIDLIKMQIS